MTRPAPRITPREIVAGVRLQPSGAHELEVAVPGGVVGMRFSRDQVGSLKRVIEAFEEQVAFEDGRSGPELRAPKFVPIEVSR